MKKDNKKFFVPGRIEFLGKHTDYCGGRSIVCVIDKGFTVYAQAMGGQNFSKICNSATKEVVSFEYDENSFTREGHWSNYPLTVIKRIAKNFKSKQLDGIDMFFTSDLPQAAGVSSSSAFIVATFLAISRINNLPEFDEYKENIKDDFDLGNYLGCLENGYDFGTLKGNKGVGTFGGSQDQTAIVCCKENTLSRFSFCPVRHEGDFALPENLCFVIASSGVVAEKTGAAMERYNRLSLMSQEIRKLFDAELSLAEIVEAFGFEVVKSKLPTKDLVDRLTQFYIESYEIIPQVSEHLKVGQIDEIGELIDRSHQNADKFLGNQVPETNFLQSKARGLGAIAASAFGAGFGGSVYALIREGNSKDFLEEWKNAYHSAFPNRIETSEFFITKAAQSIIN